MTQKTKAKVLTRKQNKEVTKDSMSEEEEMTKIGLIQNELCVAENVMEFLIEKLLLVEMRIMKLEEMWLQLKRKGLSSEVELLLVMGLQDKERKEFKPSTRKFAKLMEVIGLGSMMVADDSHALFVRQDTPSEIKSELGTIQILSNHKRGGEGVINRLLITLQIKSLNNNKGHYCTYRAL